MSSVESLSTSGARRSLLHVQTATRPSCVLGRFLRCESSDRVGKTAQGLVPKEKAGVNRGRYCASGGALARNTSVEVARALRYLRVVRYLTMTTRYLTMTTRCLTMTPRNLTITI